MRARPLLLTLALGLVVGCGPASDRPAHGASPGAASGDATSAIPPTLQAAENLRFRPSPSPSPGLNPTPSPSAVAAASPSVVAAPPIVRTIVPGPDASVPAGGTVAVSAVLVGRGADLATASLTVNGADFGASLEKRSPRDWTIRGTQPLGPGAYTARVLVRDANGANGGFTWRFSVGESEPPAAPAPEPAQKPAASPQPGP
jgi:hypothetical protein